MLYPMVDHGRVPKCEGCQVDMYIEQTELIHENWYVRYRCILCGHEESTYGGNVIIDPVSPDVLDGHVKKVCQHCGKIYVCPQVQAYRVLCDDCRQRAVIKRNTGVRT